jgi:RHS repeat-associated protein
LNRLTQKLYPDSTAVNYTYDNDSRLTQVSDPTGTYQFTFDNMGRLTGTTTSYAFLTGRNFTTSYAYDAASNRTGFTDPESGATSYYHADGLGSVTSLSNAAGSIANTYTYDSFGKLTASTGSLVNPFQYTARESDTETGLYYYRARYYDTSAARFLAEDPIRFRGGIDFYSYVHNRAPNFRDPRGRAAWGGGIGGSVAGGLFWFGGGADGFFYLVGDTQGNQGYLACSGFGVGAVAGASASVQGGSAMCPNCASICDMEGTFGGAQGFAGIGANGAIGGGASVSNTGVTIFTSGGVGAGAGGGVVGIGGSCTLVWKRHPCPPPCPSKK